MKNIFKGYQPKDNGKGTPNPPPKAPNLPSDPKPESKQPRYIRYRLAEIRIAEHNNGLPYWVIQVWNEVDIEWTRYGGTIYDNYEDALRCYEIVIGKIPKVKVLAEYEMEI